MASATQVSNAGQVLCVPGAGHEVWAFPQWAVACTPFVHVVCAPVLAPSVRVVEPPVMLRMLLAALGNRPPGTAVLVPPPK